MAPLLAATHSVDATAVGIHACTAEALGALGPLLCLHAPGDPHLLTGWARARSLRAHVRLDSDGPHEALHFFDSHGLDCWRLYLLPDSDFHAWERLLSTLPVQIDGATAPRRFWPAKRAAQRHWQACALRLHTVADAGGGSRLATADVTLSSLGRICAQRIAAGNRCGEQPAHPGWAAAGWAR
jgi:hypothetical protein